MNYGADDYPNSIYSPPNIPYGSVGNEDSVLVGKRLGLLPDQGRPSVKFGAISKADAPLPIPLADDHISGVPGWNLGGNDQYGTCGPTALANYMSMAYWNLMGVQVLVSDDAIFKLYAASGNEGFPPSPDNGVDLNYLLTQAVKIGLEITYTGVTNPAVTTEWSKLPGQAPVAGAAELVKPVAFAALDTTTIDEVRRATAIFGGVELGVTLETAQQQQTATGVWAYAPSPVWGGHAIMGAAYTSSSSGADEEIISWAQPVGLTDSFVSNQLSQAYAIILPIHLTHPNFLAGVNVSALAAQYQDLTGRTFPAAA